MVIRTALGVVRMVAIVATTVSAVPGVEHHDFLGGAALNGREDVRRTCGLRHGRRRGRSSAGDHLERRRGGMIGRRPGHISIGGGAAKDEKPRKKKS
jgi:hypothetical protein